MDKKIMFDNAYPFVLPQDKSSEVDLSEIKIPPQNIIAKLNDQWVEEIGLDANKFGYGSSLSHLLKLKGGEKITKDNLLERIRVLQTIGMVIPYLNELARKEVLEYVEKEPIIYPNLRGSRDQSCFHHKKQLTVLLLEMLSTFKEDILQKAILDLIFEIFDDNQNIVHKKTYFDEYNSYTYSEEQRAIATTIVAGIEKKLLHLIGVLGENLKLIVLHKLWNGSLLSSDLNLKKSVVKQIYFSEQNLNLEDIKALIKKVNSEKYPEEEVLKEVIMELQIADTEVDPEAVVDFYNKELSPSDLNNLKLVSKNIQKVFNETGEAEKRKDIIRRLICPKQEIEDLLGDEDVTKGPSTSHILSLVNLFLDDKKAKELIFEVLMEDTLHPSFHKDVYAKVSPREELFKQFQVELAMILLSRFDQMNNAGLDKEMVSRIVDLVKNELVDEIKGEEYIDLLLKHRVDSKFANYVLQKIYQKASDSSLGKYLQYILLTSRL